jgi:hypothetical protein
VVDEEGSLADRVHSIDEVLDWNIIEVVEPGEGQEQSGEVIRPKGGTEIRIAQSIEAGDGKGNDEGEIAPYPEIVGEVVMVPPIDIHRNLLFYIPPNSGQSVNL